MILPLGITAFLGQNPEVAKWIIGVLLAVIGATAGVIWEVVYRRLGGLSAKIDALSDRAHHEALANANAHGEIMAEVASVKAQAESIAQRMPNGEVKRMLAILESLQAKGGL